MIFSLAIVLMLVMMALFAACACSLSPNLPPDVAQPALWPATWIGLTNDPDEGGGKDHRDVTDKNGDSYAVYYAVDSQYLYLRMETKESPGWPSTTVQDEARYKWWFDTAGMDLEVKGNIAYNAEFLLMLEDRTNRSNVDKARDQLGELTLMDELVANKFNPRWNPGKAGWYITNTPDGNGPSSLWKRALGDGTAGTGGPQGVMSSDIGYRIDNLTTGGNFVDMYVSWAALGNPSSLCLIWSTDNEDPSLDQAPNLDAPAETNCLSICVPPVADFNATPTSGCEPLTVLFTDSSTGATSWNWFFPGGSPSSHTEQTPPSVIYNSPGTYNVTLTISNDCGDDTETKYITVYANPTVNITPDGGELTCATTFILLTADTAGSPCAVTSYQWYKNGSLLGETSDTLTATEAGTYKVEVECTNGCSASNSVVVTQDINVPTVNVANVAVCEGETATLIATVSGCTVKSYQWYKGTSSSSGTPIPGATSETHSIPNASAAHAGAYTCLVECVSGCKSEDHGTLTVNHSPTADFSGSPTSGCAPLPVNFTDNSTGDPTSWSWTFGDGGTSTEQNPSYTYENPGIYTVSLTVSNACGSDDDTKDNYITFYAKPTATASSNSPICEGNSIVLTGGPDGMSYSWSGPGSWTSSDQNPTRTGATTAMTGTYTLTVTDGGCTSVPVSINVVVNQSPTANAGADTEIIEGGSVVIGGSPTASGGTAPYTYSWTPTTGLNNAGVTNPTVSPSVTTTYTVTVTDSERCTDSDDVTVTVTYGCCICGFVYRAGTTEPLAGWEVILEKKTSPWHEVQRTTTDANGKYCFCGLGDGEYRVSEVVKSGWNQVSPLPNEHLVNLPGGCCDPEYGPFLNFENEQSPENPSPTVGWEASPIDKLAVLAPWIALFAVIAAGASLLVLRRRRTQS